MPDAWADAIRHVDSSPSTAMRIAVVLAVLVVVYVGWLVLETARRWLGKRRPGPRD